MSEATNWEIETSSTGREDLSNTTATATRVMPKLRTYSGDSTNITVRGRLGGNVEYQAFDTGARVAKCRMAVTRRGRDDQGQWHDASTTWYTVKMWGALGENASTCLFKGQPVVVSGRLDVNEWVSDSGLKNTELVITAHAVGHDLNFGRAQFTRVKKEGYADQDAKAEVSEEGASSVEADDLALASAGTAPF